MALVLLTIAVPLLAFGGVYPWAAALTAVCTAVLVATIRPRLSPAQRVLDTSLLVAAAAGAIHLVPFPRALVQWLSPQRLAVREASSLTPLPTWIPLSLDVFDTAGALTVFACSIATFFCCRAMFAVAGVRRTSRGIISIGFGLACAALLQRALSPAVIYGFWRPQDAGATPFGPFVNRNHAAAWLVMAIALTVGYLMTRGGAGRAGTGRPGRNFDPGGAWPLVAAVAMVVALGWTLSRSGMAATLAAAVILALAGVQRGTTATAWWAGGLSATAAAALVVYGDVPSALMRLREGMGSGPFDRPAIWQDTWVMVRDFWLFGTGPGTYRTAMLYYQTPAHEYIFNQAHNHPLQVLAEGGLMLAVPIGCGVIALAMYAKRALRADLTEMFWIRAGAAAGLTGIAVQSFWETSLRLPAVSQLAAVLAALLLYQPRRESMEPSGSAGPAQHAFYDANQVKHRERQTTSRRVRLPHVRRRRE